MDLLAYLPKALLDAGGWVVAAAIAIAVVGLLIKGKIVPGFIYDREVTRADLATAQLERQAESQVTLNAELRQLLEIVKAWMTQIPVRT